MQGRPVSQKTGFLFTVYLSMKAVIKELQRCCDYMEETEPWFDK